MKAAADGHGWRVTQVTSETALPGVAVAEQITREGKAGGAPLTLVAYHGTKGAIQVSECTVRVGKSDLAELQSAAAAWTGFAAQETTAKKTIFRYTRQGEARRALASSAEYDAAAAGAGMEILTVSGDARGSVIDLLTIKK